MRVTIIGAGLGGLALAHGLHAAGIEVAVYERSPRTGPQPASYGIHINGHGNRALHACLPAENWSRFDQSSVPAPDVVRFRDHSLGVLTTLDLSSPGEIADPIVHRRAVRRQNLHRALLYGLDEVINWDRTFDAYTRNAASTQRLPRLAFRTLLKLTDVAAPVKRAVFPATAHARETV
jgi:2-polyprenyl-6-methoxyphenol hydroxylase-like FAD-dependent oxidoreductase